MVDHDTASRLAQTACFCCGVVNIETPGLSPFEPIPHLYYADPVEGKDKFGEEIQPGVIVDIGGAMETKERMLCCHESQRDWLLKHHGMDEYVSMMRSFAGKRGRQIGREYGEGFRQHLGHAYPQDCILEKELGDLAHRI
jgi:LmbE family N-acetylglucosaminyl deacetylase